MTVRLFKIHRAIFQWCTFEMRTYCPKKCKFALSRILHFLVSV